jgi:hypothetical protein
MNREQLKRALIALWGLAAAGCAQVADEAAPNAAPAEHVATAEPVAAPATREPAAEVLPATPPASAASLPPPAPEPSVAPAVPATELAVPSAASVVSAETLDIASLVARLRKTSAINLRTKLAVKNESDVLLERFRAYHAQHGTATLAELRMSYDSLFGKLCSLLENEDPPLARDIDRSRAAIWALLSDPVKFGASAPSASPRSVPRA